MFKKIYHASSRNILRSLLKRPRNDVKQHDRKNLSCLECDRALIGNREIVGYGSRGEPTYADQADFPFPSIRFKELTPKIEALKEKETGDWRKLTVEERKALYRYSYGLTFAEFQAPTGEWKAVIGWLLFYLGICGIVYTFLHDQFLYRKIVLPSSFDHEHVYSQIVRHLNVRMNPINGISSHWDYENNRWKTKMAGYENPFEIVDEYKKMKGDGAEQVTEEDTTDDNCK